MITALLALLLTANAPGAPESEGPSLIKLVVANPNVVRGTILKSNSWRDGNEYRTKYTIAIFHQIRGQSPDMLITTVPGGTIRGRTQHTNGVPVWNEGDIVVLFLNEDLDVALDGLFTVDGNVLIDPLSDREGRFPSLYSELTQDLGRVAQFTQLPRAHDPRLPKVPSEGP